MLKKIICLFVSIISLVILTSFYPQHTQQYEYKDVDYDGFIVYLKPADDTTADVCIRSVEDCTLQAFDIYLNVPKSQYTVQSQFALDQRGNNSHFLSFGFNMDMIANQEYKIAEISFIKANHPYQVKVIKADIAIAYTPQSQYVDMRGYNAYGDIVIR